MSRPRPSPPATWLSRRGPALSPSAPHFPTNGRNAGVSPLGTPAFRPFVRPRARALARPLSPSPLPLTRASGRNARVALRTKPGISPARAVGSRAAGALRQAGGRDCLEARGGLTGQPRASRRSPAAPAAHPAGRAGETSGCVQKATAAFRPLGWARACQGATAAPPWASGRNTAVRPRATAAFRPLAVTTRGPAGSVRQAGWKRPPGGAGCPAGVAVGLQAVACTACVSRGRRAGGTSGCVRKTTAAFRPLADRTRGTGDRAPATEPEYAQAQAGTGRHGQGGRSGTYGRHAGRE